MTDGRVSSIDNHLKKKEGFDVSKCSICTRLIPVEIKTWNAWERKPHYRLNLTHG